MIELSTRPSTSVLCIATIASTSSSVETLCLPFSIIVRARLRAEYDVGGCSAAALLSVRAIGQNLVGAVLAARAVHIRCIPGIVRHSSALQVGTVPRCHARRLMRQGRQSLGGRRVATGVEIKEIERAGKTLKLNPGGLDLGLAEIIENPRPDQSHDQANDGDDDQHLDQREATFAVSTGRRPRCYVARAARPEFQMASKQDDPPARHLTAPFASANAL